MRKLSSFSKFERLAFIPMIGIYWTIKYSFDNFTFYQIMWCFLIGRLIGEFILK